MDTPMNVITSTRLTKPPTLTTQNKREFLIVKLAEHLPAIQARALHLDATASFPAEDISLLHEIGALAAPLPTTCGGLGLGTEPEAAQCLSRILQLLGHAHLAVARLYEAHVNAVRLLTVYGTPSHLSIAAHDIAAGHPIGLWVTDDQSNKLRASPEGVLHGRKSICSGAGHLAHALVTCRHPDGTTRLAYLTVSSAIAAPLPGGLQGLRAAATGMVTFDGLPISPDDWVGRPDDYLREPDFSAGAWRTSAATTGCLARLVEIAIQQLARRSRAGNPHQQARIGRAWIALETARLWTLRAARAGEGADAASSEDIVATVNFARIAIEAVSMEALALVERSLGLPAFMVGTEIERVRRDLATYLRQPAPDEILTEAASHVIRAQTRTA